MSLTEHEIMDKFVQSSKEAGEACQLLARNADPEKIGPRGHIYGNLKRALKALEGCSRQMHYFRSDARWIRLGILYAKVMRKAQELFEHQNWIEIGKLRLVFDNGLVMMNDLAQRRTGQSGPILPTQPTKWLIMPDVPQAKHMARPRLVH